MRKIKHCRIFKKVYSLTKIYRIHSFSSKVNTTSLELKNASSNVLEALRQQQLLSREQEQCNNKLNALEKKLRALKQRMTETGLALKLIGEGANEYALSRRTLESPTRTELIITFKTNSSQGLLVNMLGENVNSQVKLSIFHYGAL